METNPTRPSCILNGIEAGRCFNQWRFFADQTFFTGQAHSGAERSAECVLKCLRNLSAEAPIREHFTHRVAEVLQECKRLSGSLEIVESRRNLSRSLLESWGFDTFEACCDAFFPEFLAPLHRGFAGLRTTLLKHLPDAVGRAFALGIQLDQALRPENTWQAMYAAEEDFYRPAPPVTSHAGPPQPFPFEVLARAQESSRDRKVELRRLVRCQVSPAAQSPLLAELTTVNHLPEVHVDQAGLRLSDEWLTVMGLRMAELGLDVQLVESAWSEDQGMAGEQFISRFLSLVSNALPANESPTVASLTPRYLGIKIEDRTVRYAGQQVDFGRKERPFRLFQHVLDAGEAGIRRHELMTMVYGNTPVSENALDQAKSTANEVVANVGLSIDVDDGNYRIRPLAGTS